MPLVNAMDHRIGWRLPILMSGLLLADGRRTASRWFTVAGVCDEQGDWIPYFCTKTDATVREILEAASARWAIEDARKLFSVPVELPDDD